MSAPNVWELCPAHGDNEHACSLLAYQCTRCHVELRADVCERCPRELSPEQMHDLDFRCAQCAERGP